MVCKEQLTRKCQASKKYKFVKPPPTQHDNNNNNIVDSTRMLNKTVLKQEEIDFYMKAFEIESPVMLKCSLSNYLADIGKNSLIEDKEEELLGMFNYLILSLKIVSKTKFY